MFSCRWFIYRSCDGAAYFTTITNQINSTCFHAGGLSMVVVMVQQTSPPIQIDMNAVFLGTFKF